MGQNRTAACARLLLASLLTLGAVCAQLRRPAFVTVVDAAGAPVAGAEVVLATGPSRIMPGPVDVVRGETDARGRLVANVVVGVRYSAWAIGAATGDDGARFVSEPTDLVGAGRIVELVLAHRQPQRTLWVRRRDRGELDGATLVHMAYPLAEIGVPLELEDDVATLPPRPWGRTWVGFRDPGGTLRHVVAVEPGTGEPGADEPGADEFVLTVERPDRNVLLVTGPDGAKVTQLEAKAMMPPHARTSDAMFELVGFSGWQDLSCRPADADHPDGVEVVVHRDAGLDWFWVAGPGTGRAFLQNRVLLSAEEEVSLPPPQPIVGAVRGLRDGERMHAQLAVRMQTGKARSWSRPARLPVTAADGALRAEGCAVAQRARLLLHLTPAADVPIGERAPRVAVLAEQATMPARLDVDLAKLARMRVRVERDGAAVPGAVVVVGELPPEGSGREGAVDAAALTGLDGDVDLLLGDARWFVYVTDGHRHAVEFFGGLVAESEVTLSLEPASEMCCRVVDEHGAPVRGARYERAPRSGAGFSGRERSVTGRTKEELALLVAMPLLLRARSDGEGQLRGAVQTWRDWQAKVRVRAGDRVSEPFEVGAGDLGDVVVKRP